MSATLRKTIICQRRHRRDKRRKLRAQLATVPAAERQAIEAKLAKTYPLLTAEAQAKRP
ncbi:MAG: hypothetical protein HYY76_13610 [Acidobacteria bacterium]|nr:hypothetical protein [Acidobacteriota bacterium]